MNYYPQVEGILACTDEGIIGQGKKIPWHHRGDLKRFFQLTKGQGLLLGIKTLLGIAENYQSSTKVVLPGRDLFVVMSPRSSDKLNVMKQELIMSASRFGVTFDVDRLHVCPMSDITPSREYLDGILSQMMHDQKLFVAGGKFVYEKFLSFCSKVNLTLISGEGITGDVQLPSDLMNYLLHTDKTPYTQMRVEGVEEEGNVKARYILLER